LNAKDITLLEDTFKKFYFDHFNLLRVPDDPNQREFGYQKFNGGMNRHISLKSDKELHLLLIQNKPSDVYCSNARYTFPNLPMAEKDWKNAELIFDIDAKDLRKEYSKENTLIKCSECNEISILSESCPNCQSTKISHITLTCNDCIKSTKDEVLRLTQILIEDLAINEENIKIFFSGNEGFHIYVPNSIYNDVGSKERAEIADYIMFRGSIPETFGFKKFNMNKSFLPKFEDDGWNGRLAKHLYGTKSNRSKISQEIISGGYALFQKQLEEFRESIGIKIDPNVTQDIHRIFRLPGSINSKSGLTKIFVEDLKKFDPYVDACFIDDEEIEIAANCPIEFSLKKKKFGPFNNEQVSLPKFAAVYMMCKGIASSV
tara:strand:+ start:2412 stop:3533 length:1122 start_codon:yes stop_codon:yes gene_type:complete